MPNETPAQVPYIAFESAQARSERMAHRLIVALVLAVIMLFASNAAWLWAWSQYDYTSETTETVTVDGKDGIASYANNGGHVVNGISEKDNHQTSDEDEERRLQGNAKAQVG